MNNPKYDLKPLFIGSFEKFERFAHNFIFLLEQNCNKLYHHILDLEIDIAHNLIMDVLLYIILYYIYLFYYSGF